MLRTAPRVHSPWATPIITLVLLVMYRSMSLTQLAKITENGQTLTFSVKVCLFPYINLTNRCVDRRMDWWLVMTCYYLEQFIKCTFFCSVYCGWGRVTLYNVCNIHKSFATELFVLNTVYKNITTYYVSEKNLWVTANYKNLCVKYHIQVCNNLFSFRNSL